MNDHEINQNAADNFLRSMDLKMQKTEHAINAVRDAKSYKWNLNTLEYILKGIKKAYPMQEV